MRELLQKPLSQLTPLIKWTFVVSDPQNLTEDERDDGGSDEEQFDFCSDF